MGKGVKRGKVGNETGVFDQLRFPEVKFELPVLDMLHCGQTENKGDAIVHQMRKGTHQDLLADPFPMPQPESKTGFWR